MHRPATAWPQHGHGPPGKLTSKMGFVRKWVCLAMERADALIRQAVAKAQKHLGHGPDRTAQGRVMLCVRDAQNQQSHGGRADV